MRCIDISNELKSGDIKVVYRKLCICSLAFETCELTDFGCKNVFKYEAYWRYYRIGLFIILEPYVFNIAFGL